MLEDASLFQIIGDFSDDLSDIISKTHLLKWLRLVEWMS